MGKENILRFFSRLAQKSTVEANYGIEKIIEKLRKESPLATLLSVKTFMCGEKVTIADCFAFEHLCRSEKEGWWASTPDLGSWWNQFEVEHVEWARRTIKEALFKIPVLDVYRYHVVEQILKHTSLTNWDDILSSFQNLKAGTSGVGANIHKLKLGTLPEITTAYLPKVSFCSLSI